MPGISKGAAPPMPDTTSQFQLGYAPPEWDGLTKALLKAGFTSERPSSWEGFDFREIRAGRQRGLLSRALRFAFVLGVMFPIHRFT